MKKVKLYFEPIEHKYTDDEGNISGDGIELNGIKVEKNIQLNINKI